MEFTMGFHELLLFHGNRFEEINSFGDNSVDSNSKMQRMYEITYTIITLFTIQVLNKSYL